MVIVKIIKIFTLSTKRLLSTGLYWLTKSGYSLKETRLFCFSLFSYRQRTSAFLIKIQL